ncbi:FHA domain-containing protein [Rhodobacteraceae bacterium D3-12]|nr:FHA domain-containing protein [Rhodobacteraceae bacterium D3-12]
MKFIRDIIGEKRQMNEQTSEVAAANGSSSLFADDFAPEMEPEIGSEAEPTSGLRTARNATGAADPFTLEPETRLSDFMDDPEPAVSELDLADYELAQDGAMPDGLGQADPVQEDDDDFADILAGFSEQEEIDARDSEPGGASQRSPEDAVAAMRGLAASMKQAQEPVFEEAAPVVPTVEEAVEEAAAFVAPTPRPTPRPAPQPAPSPTAQPTAEQTRAMPTPQPRAEAPKPVTEAPRQSAAPATPETQPVEVPNLAIGRGANRQGRVKTRLLGFNAGPENEADPIASSSEASVASFSKFPLGWLIVTEGPGRGAAFTIFSGVSKIGRGKDQTVALDFGDNSISRDNHAAIAFDAAQKCFFIGHGGKANLVRRNDRPVLSTEELAAGDKITIGETVLRFVPLCGPDFVWDDTDEGDWSHAVNS